MSIRLYGHATGSGSFAQVTRGMRSALGEHSALAGIVYMDTDDDEATEPGGHGARVSLNIGNPMGLMQAHRKGAHGAHWLLLAPNGEALPPGLAEGLTEPSEVLPKGLLDGGLLTPSAWGARVLERAFPGKRILVARHGVTENFKPHPTLRTAVETSYAAGAFDVLHFASGEVERKGTLPLIQAWAAVRRELPTPARLLVSIAMTEKTTAEWALKDLGLDCCQKLGVTMFPAFSFTDPAIALSSVHLVCQPSRAEGFGMVPLEALACGTPIATTDATGSSEYMPLPGAVSIESGPVAAMGDFPGSSAPSVSVEAIASALTLAYKGWKDLRGEAMAHADELRAKWTWARGSADAIREMTNIEES